MCESQVALFVLFLLVSFFQFFYQQIAEILRCDNNASGRSLSDDLSPSSNLAACSHQTIRERPSSAAYLP